MPSELFKNVSSIVSTRKEDTSLVSLTGEKVSYTLCDRTKDDYRSHYFISFNLPHTEDMLSTGSTLSKQSPELQQLNVDEIIVVPIPNNEYNEIIDGRSVEFTIPRTGSTSVTLYSTTYSQVTKKQNSTLLGSNIAFLFCDDINTPRTGTTSGGNTSPKPRISWSGKTSERIVAHAYSDLKPSDINTDTRSWASVNQGIYNPVDEVYPTSTNKGYNYDIPVGFVSLDKGFVVLTHKDLVRDFPWSEGDNYSGDTKEVYFTGDTISRLKFTDINISFKTSVVCLALPGEFAFSSNPSWDLDKNMEEFVAGTNGFDPIQVTEIGLYNMKDELIAIAKTNKPVKKDYNGLLTFNLDIEV